MFILYVHYSVYIICCYIYAIIYTVIYTVIYAVIYTVICSVCTLVLFLYNLYYVFRATSMKIWYFQQQFQALTSRITIEEKPTLKTRL